MNTTFFQRNLLQLSLVGAIGAFTFSHAFAAEPAFSDLSSYDSNQDSTVSKEEFVAKGGTEKTFTALDSNGDGHLDQAELSKLKAEGAAASMPAY